MFCGVDIEDISRFVGKSETFLNKVYTRKELMYCAKHKNPAPHLAVRYCAKEAIVKAICSAGFKPISYKKIETTNNEIGVPFVSIKEKGFEDYNFSISLSHEHQKAVAYVIMYKK